MRSPSSNPSAMFQCESWRVRLASVPGRSRVANASQLFPPSLSLTHPHEGSSSSEGRGIELDGLRRMSLCVSCR
jgi:type II secretory pathway component PulL